MYITVVLQDIDTAWSDETDENLMRIICNISEEKRVTNNRHEIISVVAEIKKKPEQRLKRMKLAFGINGACFWHKPALSLHHWLFQLIDFLNIAEYPIEAYDPYALVSEIQGHIWNLSIEYRPKYFSYRALLDIGYCSFSSNIIYPMTGCTLRLISEDCLLSIGPTDKAVNDVQEFITHISQLGLVPVLNVGLLNVSISLNDHSKTYPSIDLRSSIHDIHLKTCFDGADILAQLIAYIANDKDLNTSCDNTINLKTSNTISESNADHIYDETVKQINTLMADAVKDVNTISATQIFENPEEIVKKESESIQNTPLFNNNTLDINNILDLESTEMLEYYNYEITENSFVNAELGATSLNVIPALEEKEFHVIHDKDLFFMDNFGVEQIYVSEGPLQIIDNHFGLPSEKNDILRPPPHFPVPENSYTLCEMTFTWHIFGGKDFPDITKPKAKDNKSFTTGMSETYKHGVSQGASKHQTINKNMVYDESNTCRNLDVLVEIQFTKIRFSFDAYPKHSIYASRQVLVISDIEIRDRLLSSDINKLLYHPNKNNIPQKNDENMITVKALNVRSNVKKNREEECSLKVSILPIRLNIDQDTLLFLEEFFSALVKRSTNEGSTSLNNKLINTNQNLPVVAINEISTGTHDFKCKEETGTNLSNSINAVSSSNLQYLENSFDNETQPIYFKEFIFSPALPICFDYHGRRVELSRGPITGLLMGLAQLQGSGICLREIINRRGILGWNKLFEFVSKEWLKDIKRNQLPNILSGIGPTNAVLQLFQGFFDLFRLPLQQYNKDGRFIRGFQLGAQSFSARTAFAALEITSRIIQLLQLTAETTFDMLSSGPSLKRRKKSKHERKRHGRPKDLREGVANAYSIVKEGINESANTLLEAAIVEHDQKGYSGAVGAVVRQLPQLVVCPAVLATQATTNILGGAKSSLVPEAKREATDKWKQPKN
ncbi:autophagy-related protein 2 homolog B-like [Drosophila hydei]|uniref:Autophagy-related protein 2 n=1 Tax=Drosophila hydei TaxID=7224 RepID=A0A6J2SWS0_DROHY|nr:autophagy-related protein 2 homolog B-like [Drosophila hydei]